MAPEFLGVGINFPFELDNGAAFLAAHEDSIAQSIWIILGTARGERVMHPNFGCGIHDLVFGVNNATTAGLAEFEVRHALLMWEPRIAVTNVHVWPERERLIVSIDYEVNATNSRYNLVYPFYLERTGV
jgi:phage baseplate assembly protein W